MFLKRELAGEYLRLRINDNNTFDDLKEFPSYVYLDVAAHCNAACRMCVFPHKKQRFMSDELFEKAATEIIANKKYIKFVVVQGRGEPLLDPKITDKVALFSKENGVPTFMSTNIELMTEEMAIKLLESKISSVIFSLDSLKKEVFENIRHKLNFDTVLENIHRFIALREKINPDTQVRIRMIEQQNNKDEWATYQKYWAPKLRPHDRLTIKRVHAWGGKLKIKDVQNIETDQDFFPCVSLWSYFSILCDGRVPLCPGDAAMDKFTIGNFYENSIKELWHSKPWNDYRELHLSGSKEPRSMCHNCRMLEEPSDLEHIGKKLNPGLYA